jgi:nicotinic acid mononucleotide adenylyltransferase/uridine phosphorylase
MTLFLRLAFSILWLFLGTAASAGSVGFYSGTFDPPTQAQIKLMRCVLEDAALPKECREIGKPISRLIVWVTAETEKDTHASARERVLMVQKSLQKYSGRVEVLAETTAQRRDRIRAILAEKGVERSVYFVSYDAYKALQSSTANDDPNRIWVIIPFDEEGNFRPATGAHGLPPNVKILSHPEVFKGISTAGFQNALKTGQPITGLVDPGVREVIAKLGLYQDVSEDLATLQKSLFEEGWRNFIKDLKSACPITINQQKCAELASRWDDIAVVTDDSTRQGDIPESSEKIALTYKKSQSEDRWAERFSDTALRFLRGTDDFAKFKPVADDIGARIFQGYPYGKLPHLRKVTVQTQIPPNESIKISQNPINCSASQGSYNMDINQYIADRFPISLAIFLKEQFQRRFIAPTDLYVHNRSVAEAFEFHRRDGFTNFYFLQTRRGQLHRNIYLAARSRPRAYRIVLTDVRGRDREANVLCQMDRAKIFAGFHEVQSRTAEPLFVFNPKGRELRLSPGDVLLFGFKGNWTRMLQANGWQRSALVKEGLDIDVFSHPTMKQRIVVARNVYGDDVNIVLDAFYRKGIRRVLYLGTAGAIADYRIGDVVVPGQFVDRHGASISFETNWAGGYEAELANQLGVHGHEKHGWVQTVFDETKQVLLSWREQSVGSLDIEGLHLGRFANNHNDLKMGVLLVISDQTLGESTIEESNAYRDLIDASVDKLIAFFLPKIAGPTESN